MAETKIMIGTQEVYASGTVLCALDEEISIKPGNTQSEYSCIFRFVDNGEDKEKSKLRMITEKPNQIVECTNFSKTGARPIAPTKPLYVANKNGRKMMLLFSSSVIGSGPAWRQLSYTFYDGGPVNG